MSRFNHIPVLLKEAIDYLRVEESAKYIDATAGGGGHTSEIIKRGGIVLCIDQDQEAIEHLKDKFKDEERVSIVKGNFGEIKKIVQQQAPNTQATNGQAHLQDFNNCSGILFDLGMSSFQIDQSERGFSFLKNQPLDMRMDQDSSLKASDIVNSWSHSELEEIFLKYGEEINASKISEEIVKRRKEKRFENTQELVDLIKKLRVGDSKHHPATKVFQALRIAVNEELDVLRIALTDSLEILKPKGRLVVISFHSLEDRIVKNTFREFERNGDGTVITKKPVIPCTDEAEQNRRSRSAKMRVFEKK